MNILLSLKKFSHIGYYIHEARTKAKERKKHHRDRLNLSNDQIKYLDKVVIPEGCSYQVNDHTFSSIDKALAYCKICMKAIFSPMNTSMTTDFFTAIILSIRKPSFA